jgi:hypothetical protein
MSEYKDSISRLAYGISKRNKDVGDSRLKEYKRTADGPTASQSPQASDLPPVKGHALPTSKQQTNNKE